MGKDRLMELQKLSASGGIREDGGEGKNINLSPTSRSKRYNKFQMFSGRGLLRKGGRNYTETTQETLQALVCKAEDLLCEIRENTRTLRELHSAALRSAQARKENQKDMDARVVDTQSACNKVYSTIKELEGLDVCTKASGTALQRMRDVQVSGLRVALAEAMERHDAELERYARGLRALVAKAVSIAKDEVCNSQEIDQFLEDGNLSTFVDNYQESERKARLSILKEVTDRHSELINVEKSIMEIRELFVQMGHLISTQGTVVDQIEKAVAVAADGASSGRRELNKAEKSKSTHRKRKLWLMAICGVVVVLVVLSVALALAV